MEFHHDHHLPHRRRRAVLVAARDDRVHPGHARKGAAKMESYGYPVYYYENTEGGHGAGDPLTVSGEEGPAQQDDEATDEGGDFW